MTKKLFLFWVLASGLAAVLLHLTGVFFETDDRELSKLLPVWLNARLLVVAGFFGAPVVSVVLPGLALRKLKPAIPLTIWILGSLAYGVLFFVIALKANRLLHDWLAFDSALFTLNLTRNGDWPNVLSLPWHMFAAQYFLAPLFLWAPTMLALGLWRKSPAMGLRFGLAMAFGSVVQAFANMCIQFSASNPYYRFQGSQGLEQLSLDDLHYFSVLFLITCCGAATSGLVLASGFEMKLPVRQIRLMAVAIVVIGVVGLPVGRYVTGPNGFAAGFPALQKSVTFAPVTDSSFGKAVVSLQAETDVLTPPYLLARSYAFAAFEPSSKAFVTFDGDRNLVFVSATTGRIEHQLAGPFDRDDYFSFAWSRDGKSFLLRSGVKEKDDPFGVKGRMTSRIRIYNTPDYTLESDRLAPMQCPVTDMTEPPVELHGDKAFILRCVPYAGVKPDTPELIRVPITKSRSIERINYDATTSPGRFDRLLASRFGTFAVREDPDHDFGTSVWLKDLDGVAGTRKLEGLEKKSEAGGLTFQGVEARGEELVARFCGRWDDVSNPPAHKPSSAPHQFCRLMFYDGATLRRLRQVDDPVREGMSFPWHKNTRHVGDLTIESAWDDKSKTGVITVSEEGVGEVQRISTKNQTIAAVSPNEKLLVMHAFDEGRLRIYRVDAAAAK